MMAISWENIRTQLIDQKVSIAPLAMFRVLFGFIMTVSLIRFMVNGWIYEQYILPKYHFSYYGFEWVKYPGDTGIYLLFSICLIAAIALMLGLKYRLASILFFISFTYIELIDKTNYLNHYYFVSLVAFLLIFLPANKYFALDVVITKEKLSKVSAWSINSLKLQLAIVYIFAGIAKLNHDWLIEAMPLKLWLPANAHLPIVGQLLQETWVAYLFSWFGAVYDLFIVAFLLYKPTRNWVYAIVVLFHLFTWVLFPIGMFPWIMILSTLIYFDPTTHTRLISGISQKFNLKSYPVRKAMARTKIVKYALMIFFMIQILFPWRYLLYPGDLFWNEEGYRFSWRVMLMEKAGFLTLKVVDPKTGRSGTVANYEFLTPQQEKMVSTQPDMILQYAKFVESYYQDMGIEDPKIFAESYVTLNGRKNQLLIDPNVDLTEEKDSFRHKPWILSYNQ